MDILVNNIKAIIKDKGFKQKAVAEKAGIEEKMFSNMLNGRKVITSNFILPISNALGATPNELFAKKAS